MGDIWGKRKMINVLWIILFILCMLIFPIFATPYMVLLLTELIILSLFSTSYNLIFGYGGMVSFGHAAYFGIGAYTLAIAAKRYGISPIVGLILAPFVGGLFALVIGWFCVRTVRLYFALLTLAFSQLLYTIVFQWYDFTGGSDGIHGIVRPEFLSSSVNFYYFSLIVVIVCMLFLWKIVESPFGWSLRAIRENVERAQFLGINDRFYRLIAFFLSGCFAAVAGALYTFFQRWASPDLLFWSTSAEPVLMCILGGMFNFFGPAVGTMIFIILRQLITDYTLYWPFSLGMILLFIVLFIPQGVVGFIMEQTGKIKKIYQKGN